MVFGGENSESYFDEGLTASMRGELPRAIQCFERAIELDRSNAAAYQNLGKCCQRLGNHEKATRLLASVVNSRPDNLPARIDYGHALIQAGQGAEARKQFGAVFERDPANARAFLGLAAVAFFDGEWADALTHARTSLANSGPNFAALFLCGRAARLAGDHPSGDAYLKQAEKLMEKTIELNPSKPEGYYLRAEVCFAQERHASALEYYRAAADRAHADRYYSAFGENFTRMDVLVKQGLCLQRMGQVDRARELGKEALSLDPENKLGKALSES